MFARIPDTISVQPRYFQDTEQTLTSGPHEIKAYVRDQDQNRQADFISGVFNSKSGKRFQITSQKDETGNRRLTLEESKGKDYQGIEIWHNIGNYTDDAGQWNENPTASGEASLPLSDGQDGKQHITLADGTDLRLEESELMGTNNDDASISMSEPNGNLTILDGNKLMYSLAIQSTPGSDSSHPESKGVVKVYDQTGTFAGEVDFMPERTTTAILRKAVRISEHEASRESKKNKLFD